MFAIRHVTGRLVEIAVRSPVTVEEVAAFAERVGRVLRGVPRKAVVCTHMLEARTFTPEVASGFVAIMRADSPNVERNGLLLATGASTLGMQIERMLRDAAHPARRTFTARRELEAWLSELLSGVERARLAKFLDDPFRGD